MKNPVGTERNQQFIFYFLGGNNMLKRQSGIRREQIEKVKGGEGVTIMDHIVEKTELLANCRLFCKVTLEPGASIGYHKHDQEDDIYYILSGIATINDNGVEGLLYPGETLYTGNGGSHSIANHGHVPVELISVVLTYQPPER